MDLFVARFLALDRVPKYLPLGLVDSQDKQLTLIQRTICDPYTVRFPLPPLNRQDLLNSILRTCEDERVPVNERVYEELALLMNTKSETRIHFGIFKLPRKNIPFQVHGDPGALVQQGSTGFITWEAGKCMSWYLSTQIDLSNKTVLELGCGNGVAGIIAAAHASCLRNYCFTDHHESTLKQAERNWEHNFEDTKDSVALFRLVDILNHTDEACDVDFLVGADILFDKDLCEGVVRMLESSLCKFKEALIFTTIRTEETYENFINRLDQSINLAWKPLIRGRLSDWIDRSADDIWRVFLGSSTQLFDPVIELVSICKKF